MAANSNPSKRKRRWRVDPFTALLKEGVGGSMRPFDAAQDKPFDSLRSLRVIYLSLRRSVGDKQITYKTPQAGLYTDK